MAELSNALCLSHIQFKEGWPQIDVFCKHCLTKILTFADLMRAPYDCPVLSQKFIRPSGRLFIFFLWILATLPGCSPSRPISAQDGPVYVQVPTYKGGSYQLSVVELKTITDLEHLEGGAARFYLEPALNSKEITGVAPEIRFIKNTNGVYIPRDIVSLQLLTMYYHFERLMELDRIVGTKDLNTWPRKVAVQATATAHGEGNSNNAFYAGQYDVYVFVPYTNPNWPLGLNAGVLAHEHFHSFFNQIFLKSLGDRFPKIMAEDPYHAILFRGINEGFADLWGWVYTGDFDFVGRSLPERKLNRRLDYDIKQVVSREDLHHKSTTMSKDLAAQTDLAYRLGTILARAIYHVQPVIRNHQKALSDLEMREMIGKALIATVKQIKELFVKKANDQQILPAEILLAFLSNLPVATQSECEYFLSMIKDKDLKAGITCENYKN